MRQVPDERVWCCTQLETGVRLYTFKRRSELNKPSDPDIAVFTQAKQKPKPNQREAIQTPTVEVDAEVAA